MKKNSFYEPRQILNIVTNEVPDWRPADKAKPIVMTDAQRVEFEARAGGK